MNPVVHASWFERNGETPTLRVHAQPGASRTMVQGLHGDALKIRIAAPPVEGRANEELIRFLARELHVPQRQVQLLSGETSRAKRFAVTGSAIDPATLLASTR